MAKKKVTTELNNVWIQTTFLSTVNVGSIVVKYKSMCDIGLKRESVLQENGKTTYHPVEPRQIQIFINDTEIETLEYMGVEITGWENTKKFISFHKDMGVDIEEHINKEVNPDALIKLLPDAVKKLVLQYE